MQSQDQNQFQKTATFFFPEEQEIEDKQKDAALNKYNIRMKSNPNVLQKTNSTSNLNSQQKVVNNLRCRFFLKNPTKGQNQMKMTFNYDQQSEMGPSFQEGQQKNIEQQQTISKGIQDQYLKLGSKQTFNSTLQRKTDINLDNHTNFEKPSMLNYFMSPGSSTNAQHSQESNKQKLPQIGNYPHTTKGNLNIHEQFLKLTSQQLTQNAELFLKKTNKQLNQGSNQNSINDQIPTPLVYMQHSNRRRFANEEISTTEDTMNTDLMESDESKVSGNKDNPYMRKSKTAGEMYSTTRFPKNIKLEPILIKEGVNISNQNARSKNFLQRRPQVKMLNRIFSSKNMINFNADQKQCPNSNSNNNNSNN